MPRDPELYPSDAEYYEDPYYQPTNTHELNKAMNYIIINAAFDAEDPYVDDREAQMLCDQEEYLFGDGVDWDEEDLTEAEYQDRSWDEYEDGKFYYGEEGDD
jgi:hypothetical protein